MEKVRKPRNNKEQKLQQNIVKVLELAIKPPALFWFCPNGGNLSQAQRGIFKSMGLRPGVSDLHFIWPGGYGVIELKAGKNQTDENQELFLDCIAKCGHHHAVCYSLDDTWFNLLKWGVPLKAKLY